MTKDGSCRCEHGPHVTWQHLSQHASGTQHWGGRHPGNSFAPELSAGRTGNRCGCGLSGECDGKSNAKHHAIVFSSKLLDRYHRYTHFLDPWSSYKSKRTWEAVLTKISHGLPNIHEMFLGRPSEVASDLVFVASLNLFLLRTPYGLEPLRNGNQSDQSQKWIIRKNMEQQHVH